MIFRENLGKNSKGISKAFPTGIRGKFFDEIVRGISYGILDEFLKEPLNELLKKLLVEILKQFIQDFLERFFVNSL